MASSPTSSSSSASPGALGNRGQARTTHGDGGREDPVEIDLEHSRWRHFTWALVGLGLGLLLVIRLQDGARWIGAPVLLGGLGALRAFVRTLRHPPGQLVIRDDVLRLTPALCDGRTLELPIEDVRHAYLLRHTVPWTTAGPILVVETARGTFEYPRDWFVADTDQRRLATALNQRLGVLE